MTIQFVRDKNNYKLPNLTRKSCPSYFCWGLQQQILNKPSNSFFLNSTCFKMPLSSIMSVISDLQGSLALQDPRVSQDPQGSQGSLGPQETMGLQVHQGLKGLKVIVGFQGLKVNKGSRAFRACPASKVFQVDQGSKECLDRREQKAVLTALEALTYAGEEKIVQTQLI